MPPHPHCHWRGVKEWRDLGLPMSTVSDEACKMYDAALTQIVNHYNDEALGGMMGCMNKAVEADPDFVMGYVMKLSMSGKKIRDDPEYAQEVYRLVQLSTKSHVTPWEKKHINAVKLISEGFTERACNVWEDILVEYPHDMFAVKYAYDIHLMTGNSAGLRDLCGRVLPAWKASLPFYGDLLGMHGFGLEETNLFSEAEKAARQAMDINRHDAWANHCVAHCKEMTGQVQDGIKFMEETEENWNDSTLLCHNYWHWALFLVEQGEFESAIGILDNHILPFMKKTQTPFSHSDAASLCFRLEAEGFDITDRWNQCYNIAKKYCGKFGSFAYFDLHYVLTMTGAEKSAQVDRLVRGLREFIREDTSDMQPVYGDVVMPIAEAFQAWDEKNYDRAVELMKPLRYKIYKVGGSYAQRDVFTLFAIHAALRSRKPENQKYARYLLNERRCSRGGTPMNERLMQQASMKEDT